MDIDLNVGVDPTLTLDEHVENRQRLINMRKAIEKQIDGETECIKNEMAMQGVESLESGPYAVTLQIRDRATLDKGELVNLGVSTEVIKKATKISVYTQLDVRERKGA